jgi:hypothetical protein
MVNNHWLVVWIYFFIFPFSLECHHPNWFIYIFQRSMYLYHQPDVIFNQAWDVFLPASFIWLRNADGDLTSPRWGWTFGRPGKEAPWKVMPGLVTTNTLLLKMVIYSWFFHGTWWCSIVMLVYQRLLFRMNDAILGYTDIPHFWAKQVNRMS